MTPKYLRLRNFKGILSGMGLHEVELNYELLPPGIIVFSAPNGSGKSTLLDASTPYRLLPYRAGSSYSPNAFNFHDHTIDDWEREFIFEMGGVRYRSLIVGDANRKKQEAYLQEWIDGAWKPVQGVDGKLGSYDEAIERIVGSPELFMTSIFRCQNARALSDYSKSDIKTLFTELLCIDHLKAISEKARRIKQDLAGKTEILMFERGKLRETAANQEYNRLEGIEIQAAIKTIADDIAMAETIILPDFQKQINDCDVALAMQSTIIDEQRKITTEVQNKKGRITKLTTDHKQKAAEYEAKISGIKDKIASCKRLIENAPALREKADRKSAIVAAITDLKAKTIQLDNQFIFASKKITAIHETENLIGNLEKELQRITMTRQSEITAASKALEDARRQVKLLEDLPCSKDVAAQCKFVGRAVETEKILPDINAKLESLIPLDPKETELTSKISQLKETIKDKASLQTEIISIEKERRETALNIQNHEQSLASIEAALSLLPKIELAEQQLPELEAEAMGIGAEAEIQGKTTDDDIAILQNEIAILELELAALVIDTILESRKQELTAKLHTVKSEIDVKRAQEAELRKRLGACEEALRQIEAAKVEIETVSARLQYLTDEQSQWAVLEKAFGNDGIIALEIDDAGPQVSALANDLLQVFGGRFSVRIDTQAQKADGKSAKEVFDITVFDNQTNEQKSIKRLSGGEKTWVEDSITKAICIYNKTASGRDFKTIFTDEKDGALDSEKKREFFQMKRRVLELGGYEREYCISQTESLKAYSDTIIELKAGEVIIHEN